MKDEAIQLWARFFYPFYSIDMEVNAFAKVLQSGGWIRKARQASHLSLSQMADRLKVSKATFARAEKNEDQQTIENLKEIGEVLNCELVYALRPKSRAGFAKSHGEALFKAVRMQHPDPLVMARRMRHKSFDPRFRKAQGWCRNWERGAQAEAILLHNIRQIERSHTTTTMSWNRGLFREP